MATARITSKGQVTIPVEVRRLLGAEEGDDLVFTVSGEGEATIRLIKRRRLSDLYGILPATRPYPGKEKVRAEIQAAVGRATANPSHDGDRP